MKIILATLNPSKVDQIQALFGDSAIRLVTQVQAGIEGEAIEDGSTLEENAYKKASYARERSSDAWVMAEDTGFYIRALGDEPGIQAAYWGGNLSTEERLEYCVEQMEGMEDRYAEFRAVVVVLSPEGDKHIFDGQVSGHLLEKAEMQPQPKMPYSAIFVPEGESACWAAMTIEHENAVSHRGNVFRKVRAFFEKMI